MKIHGGWWLVAGFVFASACGGGRVWPSGPAPVATTPDDILSCNVDSAPLVQTGRELQACGGLWVTEHCTYETALLYGKVNEEECTREVDEVQSVHNRSIVARAMFSGRRMDVRARRSPSPRTDRDPATSAPSSSSGARRARCIRAT